MSDDEFFAAIRALYTRRSEQPDLNRLTFCLLGVATPSDLISDVRVTPFNIGTRIDLVDFTADEASHFAHGLGREDDEAQRLVERIYHWAQGHPYLTQRLCAALADKPVITSEADVDNLCHDLFFSHRAAWIERSPDVHPQPHMP